MNKAGMDGSTFAPADSRTSPIRSTREDVYTASTSMIAFGVRPRPAFLVAKWNEFKQRNGIAADDAVDPDEFGAWGFEALLHDRLPRYQKLADNFGYTVEASDLATVRDGDEFIDLVASAITARMR